MHDRDISVKFPATARPLAGVWVAVLAVILAGGLRRAPPARPEPVDLRAVLPNPVAEWPPLGPVDGRTPATLYDLRGGRVAEADPGDAGRLATSPDETGLETWFGGADLSSAYTLDARPLPAAAAPRRKKSDDEDEGGFLSALEKDLLGTEVEPFAQDPMEGMGWLADQVMRDERASLRIAEQADRADAGLRTHLLMIDDLDRFNRLDGQSQGSYVPAAGSSDSSRDLYRMLER